MTGAWRRWLPTGILAVALATGAVYADAAPDAAVFAVVEGETITREEFEVNVQAGLRQQFYHGRASGEQLTAHRRDTGRRMIERILLDREARRRGIRADAEAVKARMTKIVARYRDTEGWREHRKALRDGLRDKLETDSRIARLKEAVMAVPQPEDRAVRDYYAAHPEKFTTPARWHLGLILLRVEPWAQRETWQAAVDEAVRLKAQLDGGADFAALARLHSGDASAEQGGDLGFVHQGMLASEAQQVVAALHEGEVSQPLRLLQGIALFRLVERVEPQLNDYAQVVDRARGLLYREQAQQAWEALRGRLRADANVVVNETLYSAAASGPGQGATDRDATAVLQEQ